MNAKCFICKKKLKLIESTAGVCKCGNTYCSKHRRICTKYDLTNNDCHTCSWDYLKEQQNILRYQNPVVQNPKLSF